MVKRRTTRSTSRLALYSLCCGLLCRHGDAAARQPGDNGVWLDPVTVTDTLVDDPAVGEVVLEEYTGTHTRIGQQALQTRPESVGAVVARETGVQMRSTGGAGSYTSLSFRGASSSRTGVYIDGIRLNDAATGSVDLSQLELMNIQSIDIYRGATPVQLGQSSLGGAVHLTTLSSDQARTGLRLGVGSFHGHAVQLSHQQPMGGWQAVMTFSDNRSDNDFELWNDNGTPLNPADDRQENRHNGAFDRQSLLLKLSRNANQGIRDDLMLQYASKYQQVPHWRNLRDIEAELDTGSLQFQANRRVVTKHDWQFSGGLFVNRHSENYLDRHAQIGLDAQDNRSTTRVVGVRGYAERIGESATLAINSEVRQEHQDGENRIQASRHDATRQVLDTAVQYSLYLFDERLLLTPSARVSYLRNRYSPEGGLEIDQRETATLLPQFGLRYELTSRAILLGNLGRHQRHPGFFELFGDRGLYQSNPLLRKESGINADLGFQFDRGETQRGGWLPRRFRLTWFGGWYDDLIVSAYDAQGIGRSVNSGKAEIHGVEAELLWPLASSVTLQANLTAQRALDVSGTTLHDKRLPGEAGFSANLQLLWQPRNWRLWYELDAVHDRYFDSANLLPADDATRHNLGLSWQRSWKGGVVALRFLLDNLADESIQDFNGYPRPGRAYHFELAYQFNKRVP